MITEAEISQQFKIELQQLLDKFNADLEARDHYIGYPECGEDIRMTVSIPAIYDSNHDCIQEYAEVDLGCNLWANTSK